MPHLRPLRAEFDRCPSATLPLAVAIGVLGRVPVRDAARLAEALAEIGVVYLGRLVEIRVNLVLDALTPAPLGVLAVLSLLSAHGGQMRRRRGCRAAALSACSANCRSISHLVRSTRLWESGRTTAHR